MYGKTDTRFVNKEGSWTVASNENSENRATRQQGVSTAEHDFSSAEQSSNIAERGSNSSSRLQGRQSRGELPSHSSTESKYDKEKGNGTTT